MNSKELDFEQELEKVWIYISDIKQKLEEQNRFFVDPIFLESLQTIFSESMVLLPSESRFYRARIYNELDKQEKRRGVSLGSKFEGYDAKNSFVNISNKWPSPGRMNPIGITALYVSTDVETCIKELHPSMGELMSVATIVTNRNLKIVDLSKSSSHSDDPYIRHLSIYVQEMISQGYNDRDYIFSQFISSYCQSLGYDGIGYRSKYATRAQANKRQGVNITFFNYDGCAPVESKLYQITRIATGIQPIGIVET